MKSAALIGVVAVVSLSFSEALAEIPDQIEFGRDVQPLFKSHCVKCHGSRMQKNGFRLDRRSDAMRGGTSPMIAPRNSQASRLYLKLIGNQEGPKMPPDGTMSAEEIAVIKAWIDQGARWPDEVAGGVLRGRARAPMWLAKRRAA